MTVVEKKSRLLQLIEELKQIDALLAEHRSLNAHPFMIEQYENLKVKLWGRCMRELLVLKSHQHKMDVYALGKIALTYFQNSPDKPTSTNLSDPDYQELLNAI